MIIVITGASHTGKTLLAQKLMEQRNYPYFSIDHLKMGLVRSNNTKLSPTHSDEALTAYLWPIVREIIKTAIENNQNLIVEGCYVPLNCLEDFEASYLPNIQLYCLVMSQDYIQKHFTDILQHESAIELRQTHDFTKNDAASENAYYMEKARQYNVQTVFIDEPYEIDRIVGQIR